MRTKILFLIASCLFIIFPIQGSSFKEVTTQLNIRQQPNKNSKILDVLPQGEQIETDISSNSEWSKIKYKNLEGYVHNSYLKEISNNNIESKAIYTIQEFQYLGIIEWNNWKWTYYLMSEFPGSTSTPVQGRYVNDEGFVCDNEGYIILASVDLEPYTIVDTPFGYKGKVYDTGCPSGILDVYTNW